VTCIRKRSLRASSQTAPVPGSRIGTGGVGDGTGLTDARLINARLSHKKASLVRAVKVKLKL